MRRCKEAQIATATPKRGLRPGKVNKLRSGGRDAEGQTVDKISLDVLRDLEIESAITAYSTLHQFIPI